MVEIDMCVFFCVVALLLGAAISGTISTYRGIKEEKRAFDDGWNAGKLNVLEHTKPIEKPNWPAIGCKDCDAYKLWVCTEARKAETSDITLTVNVTGLENVQKEAIEKQIEKLKKKINRGFGVT